MEDTLMFAFWTYSVRCLVLHKNWYSLFMHSAVVFTPLINTSDDMQPWWTWEVAFYMSTIFFIALESSVLGEKISGGEKKNCRTGKHLKQSCSVNCPVKSRVWNPLTVQHPFPSEFMFTKAQLSITPENSPFRDVGHFLQPQDQHRTAQFPVLCQEIITLGETKTISHYILQNSSFLSFFFFFPYALQFSFLFCF